MPHIFWVLAVFLAVAGPVIWLWSYNEAIPSLSGRVEPWRLTASVALGKIQADKMSVQEYAESLLERIKARDEVVKAWAYLDEKRVIQEARLLDETPKKNRGPLHGLPIAVKDVIYTKGKTTTTEFAAIHVGPKTRNPHDLLRTPGGSSSGSGAAIADFQISMALGIQTGGSLIRPASFNGIYGFKPTWNPVSREGRKIYALMYDTLGWYGRCVGDLVLLADIFGLQDDKDEEHAFQGIEGARFAICKTSIWPIAGPGTQDALARAADLLRSHGAEVHELELPSVFDDVPEWYRIGLHTEGRTSSLPEYRVGKDQIGQVLIEHVENSDNFTRKTQLMASDNLGRREAFIPRS
uniref:Amidase domain-containing protein n=1 Tax=Fusarium oxysporum (strain Fo5176) TaxID=660025 RepID=A0A0D2YIN8_FUSOF